MAGYEPIGMDKIQEAKINPRTHFDKKAMEELTESVRRHGVLQPILVRPVNGGKGYEIVAGHRRYRAGIDAGLSEIPAIIRELSDIEALEIQVIENLQRADLHPLEEAEGYKRLMEHGYSVEDLALKIGKSKGYIYARLKLSHLPEVAKEAFWDGILNPSVALLIARIPDPKLAEQATAEILEGDGWSSKCEPLSYRQAFNLIQEEYMLRLTGAPFDLEDPGLVTAGPCTNCPHRTGNQTELFADINNADICTNPPCYKDKVRVYGDRLLAEAQEAGQKVLPDKEGEKIFPWEHIPDTLIYDAPYVKLADPCNLDPKGRTWERLLKKHAPQGIVVRNPHTGNVHVLLDKKEAIAALRTAGHEFKTDDQYQNKQKKEERERKAEQQLLYRIQLEAIRQIVELSEASEITIEFWRVLARIIIKHSWADVLSMIHKSRGFKYERGPHRDGFLQQQIDEMPWEKLRGIIVELILCRDVMSWGEPAEEFIEVCRLHDIDLKEIENRIKAEGKKKKGKKGIEALYPVVIEEV